MKWKHELGNKTRYLKISVHNPYSLHLLEDDRSIEQDRSMQTLHMVCRVAYPGSRLTAGRNGKRKTEVKFFTSRKFFVYQKRKKYGILRKGKFIRKS